MSALFGHKKGAFTGAVQDRAGLLVAANRGLLFLDEVGELGLDEQAMLLRALEEKAFLPLGSDVEQCSDFQLITGTNRDLAQLVKAGKFREDLLARINLWTFQLPGLRERREDIEPNIRYELDQFARRSGTKIRFNKEAAERFLRFATSDAAAWRANFRDLGAAMTRMATLASGGRITLQLVDQEIARLIRAWSDSDADDDRELLAGILGEERLECIDRFDRVQLADVVRVCRQSRSLSEAGRTLFAASRANKKQPNDADRLRKYLARFDLTWDGLTRTEPLLKR
jgi:transcriptional regulatory protein RtcR